MKLIQRNKDIILDKEDLEHIYTFKDFPVFMGCVDQDPSKDLVADMSWHISKKSGMVQLNPLLPLDVVYNVSHGSGTTGKLWEQHHEAFSRFIERFKVKTVLEIGGGHGQLAKKYIKRNQETFWVIVEPNPSVDESVPVEVVKGFFDNNFKHSKRFDALIHSHVLEHVYNVDEFLSHQSSFMQESSLLLFSVPNMQVMIDNNYTNCVNFEHTMLLTEPYIEYLLAKHGYALVDKEYFMTDHSIFYCARKSLNVEKIELSTSLYDKNLKSFCSYIQFHLDEVQRLNKIIDKASSPVYLFGAHVFSQYLISFGLDTTKIVCLLDNDLKKENKRLYGTTLISKTPKILGNGEKCLVILRAGVYNEEIKNDILDNINKSVEFI